MHVVDNKCLNVDIIFRLITSVMLSMTCYSGKKSPLTLQHNGNSKVCVLGILIVPLHWIMNNGLAICHGSTIWSRKSWLNLIGC